MSRIHDAHRHDTREVEGEELSSQHSEGLDLAQKFVPKKTLFLMLAFVVPVTVGLTIALTCYIDIGSALASFFVTDPVKPLNIDRGYSVDSTSQVNVFDDEAVNGYIIKARLDPAIDANFTVRIWSSVSAICTVANPCQLSTNDMVIYGNGTNSATVDNSSTGGTVGDVLDFDVRINAGMAISIGAHDVDIIYTKERAATMQAFNTAACNAMPIYYNASDSVPYNPVNPPAGSEVDLLDIRDGKVYKIRKLPTNLIGTTGQCWMVDNLNLQPTAANPMVLDPTNSDMTSGTYTLAAASVTNPNTLAGQTYCAGLDVNIYPHRCGMQYAWTTAVVGTGSTTAGFVAPSSVCPKNWRLPTGQATTGEFALLSAALRWGTTNGANVIGSSFRGLYAGRPLTTEQGGTGRHWSATVLNSTYVYSLRYDTSSVAAADTTMSPNVPLSLRCLAR